MTLIPKVAEERTQQACASRTVSPPMGNQGDHTVGAHSQRREIKNKYVRVLYSFFLHCFRTVNRLASESPVT